MTRIAGLILLLLAPPALAGPEEDACTAAVAEARDRAARLPPGDPSRRFAERHLEDAETEMASGEVDECPELVERANHIIATRPYVLRPGERLRGYGPDDEL